MRLAKGSLDSEAWRKYHTDLRLNRDELDAYLDSSPR
jgi:hypothetical protein